MEITDEILMKIEECGRSSMSISGVAEALGLTGRERVHLLHQLVDKTSKAHKHYQIGLEEAGEDISISLHNAAVSGNIDAATLIYDRNRMDEIDHLKYELFGIE